jgi:leucyl aminopeptidase (aminopeptidase T)
MDTDLVAELARAAHRVVHEFLAVKPSEEVVVIADTESDMRMAHAIAREVLAAGGEFTISIMPARKAEEGNRLSHVVLNALEGASVVIGLTRSCGAPTYHPKIVRLLHERRTRNLSMVMRDATHWCGQADQVDYASLLAEAHNIRDFWMTCKRAHITTLLGTDLWLRTDGPPVIVECAFATESGQEAAFPDGEVSQMPVEGTAEGVIIVDGPLWRLGVPEGPVRLIVSEGRVRRVEGECRIAHELRKILETVPNASNIAELGIGLNPGAVRNGNFEEEKKARGLTHIALGSNAFYGGRIHSEVHMDMVIRGASVFLNDVPIVQEGLLLSPESYYISGKEV